jgi:hypothetical protein
VRAASFCLTAILASTGPVLAQEICPAALASELASEAPACRDMGQGELISTQGNAGVTYRLYRWISTREGEPSALYDTARYNNTAVTLSLTGAPDQPPFWSSYYWLGMAWFETPYLARHAEYGELLVIPGRYTGTGSFIEDLVFMPSVGRGWTEIRVGQLDHETAAGWITQLYAYLPPGHGIWKGIMVDYATLTGTAAVWRDSDANCCASGGKLWFRLAITSPEAGFVVAEARYTPPPG